MRQHLKYIAEDLIFWIDQKTSSRNVLTRSENTGRRKNDQLTYYFSIIFNRGGPLLRKSLPKQWKLQEHPKQLHL